MTTDTASSETKQTDSLELLAKARRAPVVIGTFLGLYLVIGVGSGVSVILLDTLTGFTFHTNPDLAVKFRDGAGIGILTGAPAALALTADRLRYRRAATKQEGDK